MQLHEDIEIGAASHTGRVRSTNEDDFLVFSPQDPDDVRTRGRLLALADGMGGVAGGAEASRAAVRCLATAFLSAPRDASPGERLRQGFSAASSGVLEMSREVPALREMGTTLTAVNLLADRLVVGHVGDSRCYLLRDGELTQLTTDHAVREPESYLTRCVGGGQEGGSPDFVELAVHKGDQVVLVTDGLWNVVADERIAKLLAGRPAQAAAESLLAAANAAGGPDNSTVIVATIRSTAGDPGELREVELPREEQRIRPAVHRPRGGLASPRWPWVVLVLALLLLVVGSLKLLRGMDLIAAVLEWFRARFA
jgi:protein phosphatase